MINTQAPNDLLSIKDLARKLGRSERYVKYMVARGFKMIAGRATVTDALTWLDHNPKPCRRVQ